VQQNLLTGSPYCLTMQKMTTLSQPQYVSLRGLPPATLAVPAGPFLQSRVPGTDADFRAVSPRGPALYLVV